MLSQQTTELTAAHVSPSTAASPPDNATAAAQLQDEAKPSLLDSDTEQAGPATASSTSRVEEQQQQQQHQQTSSEPADSAVLALEAGSAATETAVELALLVAAPTVASVYLPCVYVASSPIVPSPASSLCSVRRLLAAIDFRSVLSRGTDCRLSALSHSPAASPLLASFKQQARIASQWRKQQTAQWSTDDRHDRLDGSLSRSKQYGNIDTKTGGEESKQQLTTAYHHSAEHEQLVKPVTSRSSGYSQLDNGKRKAQKQDRRRSKRS